MRCRVPSAFSSPALFATLLIAIFAPALAVTLVSSAVVHAAEERTVVVAFFGPPDSAAERGALLGIDEASRQARYFGFVFELRRDAAEAVIAISAQRDPGALETLASTPSGGEGVESGGRDRLVLNALDPVRGPCRERLFHVAPSEAMVESARSQWDERGGADSVRIEAWHPSLVKFAARDLNKRYKERFGVGMGSAAWGGWAAARGLGEAVLRTRSGDPAQLASYFEGDFGLDGQKGRALTFRPNRQLRQPLYVVDNSDQVVGEAPFAAPGAGRDFDSLGTIRCAKSATE